MADICKCNGQRCPKKETCYRYTVPASNWQSWFAEQVDNNGNCEYYIESIQLSNSEKSTAD